MRTQRLFPKSLFKAEWYSTYMKYALEKEIIKIDLTLIADEKINRSDFVKIFYAAILTRMFYAGARKTITLQ